MDALLGLEIRPREDVVFACFFGTRITPECAVCPSKRTLADYETSIHVESMSSRIFMWYLGGVFGAGRYLVCVLGVEGERSITSINSV